jgi:hypothetical protein
MKLKTDVNLQTALSIFFVFLMPFVLFVFTARHKPEYLLEMQRLVLFVLYFCAPTVLLLRYMFLDGEKPEYAIARSLVWPLAASCMFGAIVDYFILNGLGFFAFIAVTGLGYGIVQWRLAISKSARQG